ncbi:MAG: choice-of-anchor L domain-containing protein [Taibaiella sp.]|nr:choice-of-anchor L domain-containing protein [Taibaiella sp.]
MKEQVIWALIPGSSLTSGSAELSVGPFTSWGNPAVCLEQDGNIDLDGVLPGITTDDACVLTFSFIPSGDTIKFNYVFASSEYGSFSCSSFNDVFAFFIDGGDYDMENIAVIPGTTIPVCVNSTTGVTTGPMCTAMGEGSPFSEYYVDNTSGDYIKYGGFTTVFTAIANVNPCNEYTLTLAIADGSDCTLDSGVFLEAGSLTSTALEVQTFGGAGFEYPFTNCVRGCPPGKFTVSRSGSTGEAIEVEYTLEGTAVNGVDYETLPGSVIIPAGEETVDVWIEPIILGAPVGPKTVIVNLYSPYICPGDEPLILSTDTITILDSMFVDITQGDTTICVGESVDLHVEKDELTDLTWTPVGAVVPDPTALDITVSPTTTMTYVATVELNIEGLGCPPASDQVTIEVKYPPDVSFEGDYLMCLDGELMLDPIIDPEPDEDFTFNWTPADGLSSTTIRNPLASPETTTTYIVEVNPGVEFCSTFDSVRVTVLPNDIELLNNDTVVCAGTVLPLNASGHTAFSYYWSPDTYIDNPHAMNTAITATESGYITVTASHDGCEDMPHSFYLEVQPVPEVDLGPDKTICSADTIHLYVGTTPEYAGYTYEWSPGWKLTDSTVKDPIFNGYSSETFEVTVSTPIGCTDKDTINIIVNPSDFATVNVGDTALCPIVNLQLEAHGAAYYQWEPSEGLSNDTISNPVATPAYTTNYILYATSDLGCVDTKHVNIAVYPEATTYLPDSVHIWPGESYEIELESNAHYFNWFPPEGLNSTTIPNPVASPDVRTRYFVTATTEGGCNTIDSIDIIVHTESVLDIPNAFVPGNTFADNGILKIVRRGDATLKKFEIFNRWGNKVFSTTDINEGWDGTMDGKPQPMGVYVYQIEAVLNNGKVVQLSGNVTLVR